MHRGFTHIPVLTINIPFGLITCCSAQLCRLPAQLRIIGGQFSGQRKGDLGSATPTMILAEHLGFRWSRVWTGNQKHFCLCFCEGILYQRGSPQVLRWGFRKRISGGILFIIVFNIASLHGVYLKPLHTLPQKMCLQACF